MQFSITAPEFTRIDVHGAENLLGQGGKIVTGNPLAFWAGATDFDMWRQFGYRVMEQEYVPYLINPETQLAPYAVLRLLSERGKIHTGTITVIGNEHYQAGDVVYIASKEMIYYIQSVSHSIELTNNTFTTTLTLSYGRPLGQYIPQPFDLIGRTLLAESKRSGAEMRAVRSHPTTSQVQVLETLSFPSQIRQIPGFEVDSEFTENFIKMNFSRIRNAIIKANSMLMKNSDSIAFIELRGYTMSELAQLTGSASDGKPVIAPLSNTINKYLDIVKKIMTTGVYPEQNIPISEEFNINVSTLLQPGDANAERIEQKYFKGDPGVIVTIDKKLSDDDIKYRRIPSQQAWLNGVKASDGKTVGLPINSIDIVLVIDKHSRGDTEGEQKQGSHDLPPTLDAEPIVNSRAAPDDDIGLA